MNQKSMGQEQWLEANVFFGVLKKKIVDAMFAYYLNVVVPPRSLATWYGFLALSHCSSRDRQFP